MDAFLGKWETDPDHEENVDAYCNAADILAEVRDMVKRSTATYTLTKQGDTYTSVFEMEGQQGILTFQLDKPFISDLFGMTWEITYTLKDNKLCGALRYHNRSTDSVIHIQDGKLIHEYTSGGEKMKMTMVRC